MVDFADRASAQEARDREDAIKRARGTHRKTKPMHLSCASCADPIPEARREAVPGTPWCAFCANEKEKNND